MALKKNVKFIIGIAVAAVLPLSFGLIARTISKDKISIPAYYGIEKITRSARDGKITFDTIYRRMPELQLVNQLGDTIRLNRDLEGKMLVINFIAPKRGGYSDSLSHYMRIVQKAFLEKSADLVQFITLSSDVPRDSVSFLRRYADRFNADHDHWWFLTGDSAEIYHYALQELELNHQNHAGAANRFVLVDTNRYIRGYYEGTDLKQLRSLSDQVIILSMIKKN